VQNDKQMELLASHSTPKKGERPGMPDDRDRDNGSAAIGIAKY
jgi:hypothetical protein